MLEAAQRRIWEELPADAIVLDVGAGASPFSRADWIIDLLPYEERVIYGAAPDPQEERFSAATWVVRDICDHEPWPFADKQFDFAVCSHTLEDIRDPIFVCHELARVARAGYIEVPSRLEEQSFGFQGPWAGWGHHRWLIDLEDDELTFVLKHHILNGVQRFQFPPGFQQSLSEDERVLQLWWAGGFRYRERMFYDIVEFDDYLSQFVSEGQAARRPPVTVVLPWLRRGYEGLDEAVAALEALRRREDDRLVIVGVGSPPTALGTVTWRPLASRPGLAAAWNAAMAEADTEWVLLLLHDARPRPDTINRFFVPLPGAAEGVLLGGRAHEVSRHPLTRYLAEREAEDAGRPPGGARRAAARAAALLVRADAWRAVDGFSEDIGTATTLDFVDRLRDTDFEIGLRNAAAPVDVSAPLREAILRRRFELGAGAAKLAVGSGERTTPGQSLRLAAHHSARALRAGAGGHPRRAAFLALDALGDAAEAAGRARGALSRHR